MKGLKKRGAAEVARALRGEQIRRKGKEESEDVRFPGLEFFFGTVGAE